MSASSYAELLRRPEWQRVRLKVMERDGFACRECGSSDRTLNVHHCYYTKGAKPWEYPIQVLVTLCELCHSRRQAGDRPILAVAGQLNGDARAQLNGYAQGLWLINAGAGAVVRLPLHDDPAFNPFIIGLSAVFGIESPATISEYAFALDGRDGEWIDRESLSRAFTEECEAYALFQRGA